MSQLQQDTQQLQISIEEAEKAVSFGDALRRLEKNRDFKRVIAEGYFREEAIRLVMTKGSPSACDPLIQADITKDIDAIGSLYQFLRNSGMKADHCRAGLAEQQAFLDEAQQAELDGE